MVWLGMAWIFRLFGLPAAYKLLLKAENPENDIKKNK